MKIKTKSGVQLKDLHIAMRIALVAVAVVWADEGLTVTITSTGDGNHSAGSMHPYGFAFDVRTWRKWQPGVQLPRATKDRIAGKLRNRLPQGYDVVVEATHIHVELDPEWAWRKFYWDVSKEYLT